MRKKRRASYAGFVYEEPTVGWSSEEDVKSKLTKVDLSCSKPIPAAGPPIICDGKTAYIDTSDAHTAVCAISGMGKSIFVFMAEIFLIAKAMENAVIFDPKAELYNRTAGYLAQEFSQKTRVSPMRKSAKTAIVTITLTRMRASHTDL